MYILFIQVQVFSSHADHTGNQAIYNDKHHIKPDIHLQKAIQNIKAEMNHNTVEQIVVALQPASSPVGPVVTENKNDAQSGYAPSAQYDPNGFP